MLVGSDTGSEDRISLAKLPNGKAELFETSEILLMSSTVRMTCVVFMIACSKVTVVVFMMTLILISIKTNTFSMFQLK